MAWLMPPPEIRPPAQSACVEISENVEPGPAVAPGVFTVTPTVLAYAVPGTAIARTAPTASAFTAAARRTKPLNIDNFLPVATRRRPRPTLPGIRRIRRIGERSADILIADLWVDHW
ncbi:hypothetical protein ACFQ0M_03025 [Kitasatospora aburaviensis]